VEAPASEDPASRDLEGGISLAREGDEAAQLRFRSERPARIGRFLMWGLGAVTAAGGVAAWITNGRVAGLALGIFGTVLIVLGLIQHLLLRRDLQHWPDQVVLREDGLELFLHNGEVRGLSWTDSDLAIDLVERRAPPPANREYLLIWVVDSKIPPVELSADGYARLRQAAEAQRLIVTERRRGRGEAGTQWIEIHHGAPMPQETPTSPAEALSHNE